MSNIPSLPPPSGYVRPGAPVHKPLLDPHDEGPHRLVSDEGHRARPNSKHQP
ncbi:hypothetical protein QDW18_gp32 [Microbacterium phage Katzastrophic]|uniref:hypothetical protein n=1 Tax=Microbacterium phage Katzastrophic TaxID=2912654 RepID=UPI00242B3291|nr:hypothetical protein QDW18_gp32 [Microbacterium phage Katzastrophic]UKH48469.1 hypothetical protein SEA_KATZASTROPHIC_32 [Microbacterium phage Katzastrophic]